MREPNSVYLSVSPDKSEVNGRFAVVILAFIHIARAKVAVLSLV